MLITFVNNKSKTSGFYETFNSTLNSERVTYVTLAATVAIESFEQEAFMHYC